MQVLRYATIVLAMASILPAQTLEVSITLKPEWHASFEKGMTNLNQRRARSGQPAQTPNEFLTEALQRIIFSIVDTQNEPADKPVAIQQAAQAIALAQRARQALAASISPVAATPVVLEPPE